MFNFGEELHFWTHPIHFQVKISMLFKSDGKILAIWRTFGTPNILGTNLVRRERKRSRSIRTCKTTSTASDFRYTCSCGHHRTNQGLPLQQVIESISKVQFETVFTYSRLDTKLTSPVGQESWFLCFLEGNCCVIHRLGMRFASKIWKF